ncbi:MAG: hypothetical protein V9E90_01450 [Saprospiraceae bacterium]
MNTTRPLSSIDSHYRNHPKRYSRTTYVKLKVGVYSYNVPEDTYMNDKEIIGMSTRRQTTGTPTRFSKDGYELAGDAVLNSAYITVSNGNTSTLESYPLENMVADTKVSGQPGQYDQLAMLPGVRLSACKIEIPANVTIVANTVLELTSFYIFDDDCI